MMRLLSANEHGALRDENLLYLVSKPISDGMVPTNRFVNRANRAVMVELFEILVRQPERYA